MEEQAGADTTALTSTSSSRFHWRSAPAPASLALALMAVTATVLILFLFGYVNRGVASPEPYWQQLREARAATMAIAYGTGLAAFGLPVVALIVGLAYPRRGALVAVGVVASLYMLLVLYVQSGTVIGDWDALEWQPKAAVDFLGWLVDPRQCASCGRDVARSSLPWTLTTYLFSTGAVLAGCLAGIGLRRLPGILRASSEPDRARRAA